MSRGKPMGADNWPQAKVDRLIELWGQGLTCQKIGNMLAEEFGRPCSKNAVIGKADRIGLARRQAVRLTAAPLPAMVLPSGKARACLWIDGDPRTMDPGAIEYCGEKVMHSDTPYCRAHTRRAYKIPPPDPRPLPARRADLDGPEPPEAEAQWLG